MDTLVFIAAIACLAVVALWYVANERAGAKGDKGFLAIAASPPAGAEETYREKAASGEAPPAFTAADRRRRYAAKDDAAFRATGSAARFGVRPGK